MKTSRFLGPRRRALASSLGVLSIGLFCAGCGSNSASTEGGSAPQKLSIGYLPNIVIPQPLGGLESGDFARGLPNVTLSSKTYGAGPGQP